MTDRGKVLEGLKHCSSNLACRECVYHGVHCIDDLCADALELIKEQGETIVNLALNKEKVDQTRESVKPTVDEFGNAYCICGESVGFIPQNDKTLPKVLCNYCNECGRKLVWE